MTKFGNLEKLEISQSRSWIDLPEVGAGARLLVVPATESNPAYYNAMLRLSTARSKMAVRSNQITAKMVDDNRSDDRQLYPDLVIVDWENIVDENGEPAQFTRDNCADFCAQLPSWLFDRIRNEASTPERFLDVEDLVGN